MLLLSEVRLFSVKEGNVRRRLKPQRNDPLRFMLESSPFFSLTVTEMARKRGNLTVLTRSGKARTECNTL